MQLASLTHLENPFPQHVGVSEERCCLLTTNFESLSPAAACSDIFQPAIDSRLRHSMLILNLEKRSMTVTSEPGSEIKVGDILLACRSLAESDDRGECGFQAELSQGLEFKAEPTGEGNNLKISASAGERSYYGVLGATSMAWAVEPCNC